MPTFEAPYLEKTAACIFVRSGAPEPEAETTARCLVRANLLGHDSHGVIRVKQYVDRIRARVIVLPTRLEIKNETTVSAVVDGHWGLGPVIAAEAG